MADNLQDFLSGKGSYSGGFTPSAPPSYGPATITNDNLKDFLNGNVGNNNKVSIALDPKTRAIKIYAPSYYTNSEEFKTQVLPQFQKLKGKALTDTDFTTLVNSDMLKQIQQQADDIEKRFQAVQAYKSQFPHASDQDAITYLQNLGAGKQSDNDSKTQLYQGRDANGNPITTSVKDFVAAYKKMNDTEKGNRLNAALKKIDDPNTNEDDRAVQLSLVQVLKDKGLLDAGALTQLNRAAESGLNAIGRSIVGKVTSVPAGLLNLALTGKYQDLEAMTEESLKNDPAAALDKANKLADVVGPATDVLATGADIAATSVLGGEFVKGGQAALSTTAKGAKIAEEIGTGLDKLEAGSKIAKIGAGTIKGIPADLSYGTLKSLTDNDYNGPQQFALNTALNAATLGATKLAGRGLLALDTATNGKLLAASEKIGKLGVRGLDAIEKTPIIGKAMKSFSTNFIDQAAPLRRAARTAWAKGEISTGEYQGVSNSIRAALQKGRPEAVQYMRQAPEFKEVYSSAAALEKMGKDQLHRADQYVNAVQQLQYAESGRYKVSQAKLQELRDFVEQHKSDAFDDYRQKVADWNAAITDFGIQHGILDQDIINAMRTDPAFAAGYVRLQKEADEGAIGRRLETTANSLRGKQAVQKLTGPAAIEDLASPYVTANDRLQAISELAARNQVNQVVAAAINDGWVSGRILQAPSDIKLRNTLRLEFANEKKIVDDLVDTHVGKLNEDLNRLADDVEDFNGSGRVVITARIQDSVDDMVDAIKNDESIHDELIKVMDSLGAGKAGSEDVAALAILSRNKARIGERIEKALQNTELGKEQRAEVVQIFDSAINGELDKELATRGVGTSALTAKRDEIRELNNRIAPNKETTGPDAQAFYENGTKGYYQLDDQDMMNYFNQPKSTEEPGWFAKLMTNTSRLFKVGTTGINPRFLLVNPARDVPQSIVSSGLNVLNPTASYQGIIDAAGSTEAARKFYDEFQNRIGSMPQVEINRYAENAAKNANAIGREVVEGKAKSVIYDLKNPAKSLRNLEDLFGKTETAVRSRVYVSRFNAALERGLTATEAQREALFYAANATTDFLNVGGKVHDFVRTVPYLTAAINGSASMARLFMLDPIGVAARLGAGIVTPALWLTIHNFSDPDRAAGYMDIPQYERSNNFIIMLDGKNKVEIPMSQELAKLVNPFRERVEAHYGLDTNNFMETAAKFVLSQSPIDLSPLQTRDYTGNVNLGNATAQIASNVFPQLLKVPLELVTGKDLYTGNQLSPTDAQLIESGQVQPGDEITAADRTFKGSSSQLLSKIANFTHIDQGRLQSIIKNFTGQTGMLLLNGLDTITGAPPEQRGGTSLAESIANRFFGTTAGQMNSDYYDGINRLEEEKKTLQTQLTKITNSNYDNPNDAAVNDQRQKLIDAYGEKVAQFANQFGQFYKRAGGFKPYQLDSLVRLLDLGPDNGAFAQGSYQAADLQTARNDSRAEAIQRAIDLGLPTSNERDRYGRLLVDANGNPYQDYSKTSLENQNIQNRVYGAPKQLAYEYSKAVKADKSTGQKSLYDIEQSYFDRLDALYTKARGLKGKAAEDIYHQISAIQEEYMTNEFDKRVKPLLDKYGPEALMNNKDIFDEISSYIMVPGDFTPFTSRKKQPYQKDDVEAYLLDRYGVGKLNQYNLPSDTQATNIVNRVNSDLAAGRTSSALYKLQGLQNDVNSGRVYVDNATMDTIKRLIAQANK